MLLAYDADDADEAVLYDTDKLGTAVGSTQPYRLS